MELLTGMGANFAGGLGTSLGRGIAGAPSAGPLVSGGGAQDARSFMDGSGWTVSTGGSRATGGTVGAKSQDGTLQPPPGFGADQPMARAGVSPAAIGIMLAVMGGAWLWSRRNR